MQLISDLQGRPEQNIESIREHHGDSRNTVDVNQS